MKYAIISGSHRPQSESKKVAVFLAGRLQAEGSETYILDLGSVKFPFWDEGLWSESAEVPWNDDWTKASQAIDACDAVIVISPEWGGMVPAALKNFFLLCGKGELAHKPALIVAVSSGVSGSYPITELRMSSYKNTHICYLPDHVIVRNVGNVLNFESPASSEDEKLHKRIGYSLELLKLYARAMAPLRHEPLIKDMPFPYGM